MDNGWKDGCWMTDGWMMDGWMDVGSMDGQTDVQKDSDLTTENVD